MSYEKRAESLATEIKNLQGELGDYNTVSALLLLWVWGLWARLSLILHVKYALTCLYYSCVLKLNDKLNTDTDIRDVERDYDDLKTHNDVEEKGLDSLFEEKQR